MVRKEDHRAECAALGQGIVLVPGSGHIRDEVDARCIGGILCDRPVFDPLIWFEVAPATKQDGRYIVVRGREGEHYTATGGWIRSDCMGNVRQGVFYIVLVVEYFGAPVGLDEEISGREKPGEGEEVGGEGVVEDVQPDRLTSRGKKFVSGVILTGGVYEAGETIRQSTEKGNISVLPHPPHWLPPIIISEPSSIDSSVGYHLRVVM